MKLRYVDQPAPVNPDILCPVSGDVCPSLTFLFEQSNQAEGRVREYDERADRMTARGLGDLAMDQRLKADPFVAISTDAQEAMKQIKEQCVAGPKTRGSVLALFGPKVTQCSVLLDGQPHRPAIAE